MRSARRFAPPWWASLLVLLLSALMVSLGIWQLHRGQAKQLLRERYAQAGNGVPQDLILRAQALPGDIARVRVHGRYDAAHQLLLDNQGHEGRPGYHVWTPLRRLQGDVVLVDRGWVARGMQDAAMAAPLPANEVELSGYWRSLPVPGMRVADDNCRPAAWPRLVQYPRIEDLRCLYGATVAQGLLLLDAAGPDGFVRDWQTTPELDPAKHWGYAFQWFAFTLTLWILYLRLNWRRQP